MCRSGACVNDSSTFLGAERQDSLADCVKTCKDDCGFVSFCPKEKPLCNTTKVNLCARYSSCKNSTESSNPGYPLHVPLHMQQWNDSYPLPTWRGVLTNNAGCSTVQSRTACCSYLDGNQDDGFFGEPCVPAKLGTNGFGKNNQDEVLVCAPLKWTKANYPDSYAEFMEVCKHTNHPNDFAFRQ